MFTFEMELMRCPAVRSLVVRLDSSDDGSQMAAFRLGVHSAVRRPALRP